MAAIRQHPMIRPLVLAGLLTGSAATAQEPALTAEQLTERQQALIAEQAAALDEAPRLTPGASTFEPEIMAAGFIAWLEVSETGLYRITVDGPGALVLASFSTPDGQYDGQTRQSNHASDASLDRDATIGPVLLSNAHPYMVSISSASATTVRLERVPADLVARPTPTEQVPLADGAHLFTTSGRMEFLVTPDDRPRSIEVITEPRARLLEAELGGMGIRPGGLLPWRPTVPERLVVILDVPDGTAEPAVLVRISTPAGEYDETEPNHDDPDILIPGQPFTGVMLAARDEDVLAFSVPEDGDFSLSVTTDQPAANFTVELRRPDAPRFELWKREPRGSLIDQPLRLTAGDYEFKLQRMDRSGPAVPYVVELVTRSAPGPGREIEPNDRQQNAMRLPESLNVRGNATGDDVDYYAFSVPDAKAGHSWRLFAIDARRITLFGRDGEIVRVDATGPRLRADSLALVPGDYVVQVLAEADYVLRMMDLGDRPPGFEAEPNDSIDDGMRLEFGATATGGFHVHRDRDFYLFRLDAPGPVEIGIVPSSDGATDARLYHGIRQWGSASRFEPGIAPMTFRSTLPAGDWAIELRSLEENVQETYEVSVQRLPALAGGEPDDTPLQAVKMPRTGDFTGTVGGFDEVDQWFVSLPRGDGIAAMFCDPEPSGRWRVFDWTRGDSLGDIRDGVLVFPYGPELGGAVRFELLGNNTTVDYACRLRFAPSGSDPTADGAGPALQPGFARSFELTEEALQALMPLSLAEGENAALGCWRDDGTVLTAEDRVWRADGADAASREPLGDFTVIRAGAEPMLNVNARLQESFPVRVRCALLGIDDLPRPTDMGPAAEFDPRAVASATVAGNSQDADGGPPPPGLEALIQRPVPESQATGDLPVHLEFGDLPTLAGYVDAGQTFDIEATLTNRSASPLSLDLAATVAADRWRVEHPPQIELAPGASRAIPMTVRAPAWISAVLQPTLALRAQQGDAVGAAMTGITISADATAVGPVTWWDAPDALRGGLNVLHHGLGARLVEINGEATDEQRQTTERWVHDGLAPHITSQGIQQDLVFRLAAESELAGAMIHLRSTDQPASWPTSVEFYVPDASGGWQRIAAGVLETVHTPQYFVFDAQHRTERLRVRFPACRVRCEQPSVQDIQAIAVPGTHPGELPPINAAALELGGHVVHADLTYSGQWNSDFLHAHPTGSNGSWRTSEPEREFVVGFHQNRAALLQSLVWLGDPKDDPRVPYARVEASVGGPGGPWVELGRLEAPPIGELRSELVLDEASWARYLRFTLPMENGGAGPDGIEALEVPGTSVLALWEDDQPRAAWEARFDPEPAIAVAPAGGADRESAVPMPVGEPVESSVRIERNEDWWTIAVPGESPHRLELDFGSSIPAVTSTLLDAQDQPIALESLSGGRRLQAVVMPGEYSLRINEPPRSVVISWDTSGSVAKYLERTLAAVRTWARSLQPGRDALQLLPFGPKGFLLDDWAERPEDVEPALRELPEEDSSDSEEAMMKASEALADRRGSRGIVIITDAETGMEPDLWPALLDAMPRVISLSIDSNSRQNAAIMMDWAAVNGGRFRRVIGPLGLADGLDMANALFRAPKSYRVTASLEELVEPEGEATLVITPADGAEAKPAGAVELILDASGSMLQRMEGRRRIDIAHDALERLVRETLPENTPFAFRAFGLEQDACRTELLVPLGPLDRQQAATQVTGVPAINLAKTAIADSLLAARDDLADTEPPRVVVLVTDGEETCDGDPAAAIEQLRESGFDARINIVGFAIDDAELAATFAEWAETGGGTYFNSSSADALESSIAEALKPRFELIKTYLDGRTEVVGNVALGESIVVPAGQLAIVPASGAIGEPVRLQIAADRPYSVGYAPSIGLELETGNDEEG